MPCIDAKVYSDGHHYIAIPKENFPSGQRKRKHPKRSEDDQTKSNTQQPENAALTPKEKFEKAYADSAGLKKAERKTYLETELKDAFNSQAEAADFIEENLQRKQRNEITRKIRLYRKLNLQTWNYFCTFTYDDKLHTEESFKKKLKNTLSHLSSRKGWKYIGVWERGGKTERLHFHCICFIPDNGLIGEFIEIKDYNTKTHKMQITMQNTHFLKHFGRNDFESIAHQAEVEQSIRYIIKYIEKSGERIVYSRGLYAYIITDILDEEMLCPYGVDDRKIIIADNFTCIDNGEIIGTVCPEVISKMRKSN